MSEKSHRLIAAIDVEPTPWVVLKTKKMDGKKVFLNVLHHVSIPSSEDEAAWKDDVLQAYITRSFVLFTLNRIEHVMFVGEGRDTADKEGGSSMVMDIIIHPSVYIVCSTDEVVCDKVS